MLENHTNKSIHVILLAHGSRDPKWTATFDALFERVSHANSVEHVSLAYMELAEPTLESALDTARESGATHIQVLPLFFAAGRHLREDVPRQIATYASQHTGTDIELLPPVGEHEAFSQAVVSIVSGTVTKA